MNRNTVYDIIDGERDYQDQKWDPSEHGDHEVEAFILYMEHYLSEARRIVSTSNGTYGALDMMRKVVALGVACFEQHGVPAREVTDAKQPGNIAESTTPVSTTPATDALIEEFKQAEVEVAREKELAVKRRQDFNDFITQELAKVFGQSSDKDYEILINKCRPGYAFQVESDKGKLMTGSGGAILFLQTARDMGLPAKIAGDSIIVQTNFGPRTLNQVKLKDNGTQQS